MNILEVVCSLVVQFATLAGVAGLVAILVNLFKVFKWVKDGDSAKWSAGLNLVAFVALVLFRVFRPDLPLDFLDTTATQITAVLLFITGYVVQIAGSKGWYEALRGTLISKSLSN